MARFFRIFSLPGLVAGLALLTGSNPARAGLVLQASVNGGSFFNLSSNPGAASPSAFFLGNVDSTGVVASGGTFQITFLGGASTAPGTANYANLLTGDTSITNLTNSTQSIEIRVGANFYNEPVTPPDILLLSSIGGTVNTGANNADNQLTYQSFVNQDNSLGGISGFSAGAQTASSLSPGFDVKQAAAFSNNASPYLVTLLTAPYSVVQRYSFTLGAGASLGFQAKSEVLSTPEPGTFVSSLMGLAILGGGAWMRRRGKAN